jgi:cytochrome P450
MAWALYFISQHPYVEERICAELDAADLLATPAHPVPRDLELPDLSRLPYLSAAIKESMRLRPVAASGTSVELPRPLQVGSWMLPAGVPLWLHMFTVHNSELYWERASEFLPVGYNSKHLLVFKIILGFLIFS